MPQFNAVMAPGARRRGLTGTWLNRPNRPTARHDPPRGRRWPLPRTRLACRPPRPATAKCGRFHRAMGRAVVGTDRLGRRAVAVGLSRPDAEASPPGSPTSGRTLQPDGASCTRCTSDCLGGLRPARWHARSSSRCCEGLRWILSGASASAFAGVGVEAQRPRCRGEMASSCPGEDGRPSRHVESGTHRNRSMTDAASSSWVNPTRLASRRSLRPCRACFTLGGRARPASVPSE